MSRYHFWGFIVNQAGEPIEDAEITVKLAGTDLIADVYYDEFGNSNSVTNPTTSAGPQLSTLSNGFYEFWIGDRNEVYGYSNEQKFKLEWIRIGVASGEIDYINVFPLGPQIEAISLSECGNNPSRTFNKLISDYYACKWNRHVDSEIFENGYFNDGVHGLEFVDVGSIDEKPNKLINNFYGNRWNEHALSTVTDLTSSSPVSAAPHGILPLIPGATDEDRMRVVSNADITNLHTRITNLNVYVDDGDTNLQIQIDELYDLSDQSQSGWFTIYNTMWVYHQDNIWYYDIVHNLNIYYPIVYMWEHIYSHPDFGNHSRVFSPYDIFYFDQNTVRIFIEKQTSNLTPTTELEVRISNGGVQRVPASP